MLFHRLFRSARERSIKSVQNLPRPEKQFTELFFTPQAGSGFRFPHGEQKNNPECRMTFRINW